MTTFLLILMALLLVAALERNHRRQPLTPPGPHGSHDQDDRDWARIRLELLDLGAQPRWTINHHNGPRLS